MNLKMLLQLGLCFIVTYSAQSSFASKSMATVNCANALSQAIIKKYDSADSVQFNFTRKQLAELKKVYHGLAVPNFVSDISLGQDKPVNAMLDISSQFVEVSADGLAVFIPNTPVYHLADEFKAYVSEGRLSDLKSNPNGLSLSTWFMHPELSRVASKGSPIISQLESEGEPYLASMLDLNRSHVPHLKELQRLSVTHIQKVYGVNSSDNVEMYFHFPYSPKTVTLHLHIRVNQKIYDLERAKSYALSDVIKLLESGGNIESLILSRQQHLGGLFTNRGTAEGLVEQYGIGEAQPAVNPFFITGE